MAGSGPPHGLIRAFCIHADGSALLMGLLAGFSIVACLALEWLA